EPQRAQWNAKELKSMPGRLALIHHWVGPPRFVNPSFFQKVLAFPLRTFASFAVKCSSRLNAPSVLSRSTA
ncbi:MAG: hypothetical protein Q8R64_02675, partial [Sulfurimicrobium sp.]|nr:hypothetical protein [Sulfurimicrobium sp.]